LYIAVVGLAVTALETLDFLPERSVGVLIAYFLKTKKPSLNIINSEK